MLTDTPLSRRLPAEWEEQDGVLLAWPHAGTDWQPVLGRVEPAFAEIIAAISRHERALVVIPEGCAAPVQLLRDKDADLHNVQFVRALTNDTWARDFGPVTVYEDGVPLVLDFGFNGWGLKFPACHDNRITRILAGRGLFSGDIATQGLILEGGSIESDGKGAILTTATCLLGPNRNPHLAQSAIEEHLARLLGATHLLWLDHGYLAGDDTDSHIDTLARLCPDDTILHLSCDDPSDEHFSSLRAMQHQLQSFRTPSGGGYRLVPLPLPAPCYGTDGERLPATYANYLVINGAVLVPTYGDPHDRTALATVGTAFPGRAVIGIDCRDIILQHGSLHCLTMQLPKGTLA